MRHKRKNTYFAIGTELFTSFVVIYKEFQAITLIEAAFIRN